MRCDQFCNLTCEFLEGVFVSKVTDFYCATKNADFEFSSASSKIMKISIEICWSLWTELENDPLSTALWDFSKKISGGWSFLKPYIEILAHNRIGSQHHTTGLSLGITIHGCMILVFQHNIVSMFYKQHLKAKILQGFRILENLSNKGPL